MVLLNDARAWQTRLQSYKHKCLLVSGGAAIPESSSEVIAAGHEAGVGG